MARRFASVILLLGVIAGVCFVSPFTTTPEGSGVYHGGTLSPPPQRDGQFRLFVDPADQRPDAVPPAYLCLHTAGFSGKADRTRATIGFIDQRVDRLATFQSFRI